MVGFFCGHFKVGNCWAVLAFVVLQVVLFLNIWQMIVIYQIVTLFDASDMLTVHQSNLFKFPIHKSQKIYKNKKNIHLTSLFSSSVQKRALELSSLPCFAWENLPIFDNINHFFKQERNKVQNKREIRILFQRK